MMKNTSKRKSLFKRILSALVATAMCAGMLPSVVFAEEPVADNDSSTAIVTNITEEVYGAIAEDGVDTEVSVTSVTTEAEEKVLTESEKETDSETSTSNPIAPLAEEPVIVDNGDGTTTETNTTKEVYGPTTEDDVTTEGEITTETSVTTDAEGNVLTESEKETGSETSTTGPITNESTEIIFGEGGAEIVTKAPGEGEDETVGKNTIDDISASLVPDTSGEEWVENEEDGSKSKTETNEDGSKTTTTVSKTKDEDGNDVYTTSTVTTTERTEPVPFDVPEESETTNADGSVTTVTLVREGDNVIGYTEVTELRDGSGTLLSSTTMQVIYSGESTTTTTTTNTKTQIVDPNATTEIKVTMGEVTAGDGHGNINTHGPDVPMEGFTPNDKIDLDQLGDDDLVFVSGLGVKSKHELAVIWGTNVNSMNSKASLYATQYVVTDKSGNTHVVYCADMSTPIDADIEYYLTNTEDAAYYTNSANHGPGKNDLLDPDGGAHIREIATNGYWGTESGTGSLSKMIDDLLAAKAAGNSALENLTEDEIRALTPDLALSATQAAIWRYGNSMNSTELWWSNIQKLVTDSSGLTYDEETHTFTKVTETIDPETGDKVTKTDTWTMTVPPGLDLSEMISVKRDENGSITMVTYPNFIKAYMKLIPDGWLNGPSSLHTLINRERKDSYENQMATAIYNYLCGLDINKEDTTTDLIQPSDIVEAVTNVKNAIEEKDPNSNETVTKYEADVSFVLTVEPDRLNGDLVVNVYDSETGEVLTTRRLEGDGSNDAEGVTAAGKKVGENGITYTIDGLMLANGQKINIKLSGSQEVKKGAYLITAQTGTGESQTFVGIEEGSRDVDLSFDLQLNVNGVEVKTTETEETTEQRDWTRETNITYSSYELELPEQPEVPDEPEIPDEPEVPDNPDPDPDPEDPTVEIPDEPTPLVDIPDAPVPLMEQPQDDLIDIFDDDVPLAGGLPTGNEDAVWYLLAAFSLMGLGLLKLLQKKSEAK